MNEFSLGVSALSEYKISVVTSNMWKLSVLGQIIDSICLPEKATKLKKNLI